MPVSINEKLSSSGGRPAGFDYLRLILSVGVVCIHSQLTSVGTDLSLWISPLRPIVRVILPMFFALSGYLVSGSLSRSASVFHFISLRILRIYPALAVEVLLSALIIGPALTMLPLNIYFGDSLFRHYLLNALGDIHYKLPGLFLSNPYSGTVNAQLWTVPCELLCYVTTAVLTLAGLKHRRWIGVIAVVGLTVGYSILRVRHEHGIPAPIQGRISSLFLLVSFLCGMVIYLYGERIIWSRSLCVGSGLISAVLISVVPNGDYIVAPFVAYFTVSLGLMDPRRVFVLRGADLSYGIFLYGFVIQQTLMHLLPWARVWWLNIGLSVPCAAAFAAVSYYVVERPCLRLKPFVPQRLSFSAFAGRGVAGARSVRGL